MGRAATPPSTVSNAATGAPPVSTHVWRHSSPAWIPEAAFELSTLLVSWARSRPRSSALGSSSAVGGSSWATCADGRASRPASTGLLAGAAPAANRPRGAIVFGGAPGATHCPGGAARRRLASACVARAGGGARLDDTQWMNCGRVASERCGCTAILGKSVSCTFSTLPKRTLRHVAHPARSMRLAPMSNTRVALDGQSPTCPSRRKRPALGPRARAPLQGNRRLRLRVPHARWRMAQANRSVIFNVVSVLIRHHLHGILHEFHLGCGVSTGDQQRAEI